MNNNVLNDPDNNVEMKYCVSCQIDKPITDFVPNQKRRKCRLCLNRECRDYKACNREKISVYNHKYKQENKDYTNAYNKIYFAKKKIEDPHYKIVSTMRVRLNKVLDGNRKDKHTKEFIGCDLNTLIKWFEFLFTDEMTINNHGEIWHMDHVLPCATFDMEDGDEQSRCFHWSNIRPLIAIENLKKGDRITKTLIKNHHKKVKQFMKENNIEKTEFTIGEYETDKYINKRIA